MCGLPSSGLFFDSFHFRRLEVKTVKICCNHAEIVPAAVVATGPEDVVLNELAVLLLQLPEVGLRVEDFE